MTPDAPTVVGIDLGGTKITAGLVDGDGRVLFSETAATPAADGPAAVLAVTARLACTVAERGMGMGRAAQRVGVGASGVVDSERGIIASATDSIPDWVGADIRGRVQQETGLDTFVINDVHAHAIGEAWIGAGRGHRTVLLVTVGTGVGGAYLGEGGIQLGAHGLAGHLGHVASPEAVGLRCTCGSIGHVEAVASGPAIHASYLRRGGDPGVKDTRALMDLVREHPDDEGIVVAREAIVLGAVALGRMLGGMINTVDPEVVIVGGGVGRSGGIWWEETVKAIAGETLLPVDRYLITPPMLGQESAIVGAARFAAVTTLERR